MLIFIIVEFQLKKMSNVKQKTAASATSEAVEEELSEEEDNGEEKESVEEKPHQNGTEKIKIDNGILENGRVKRKERETLPGEKKEKKKWVKRKFPPREEIARIRYYDSFE